MLFATGNLAVAPIACGAISIGLISLGGLGIGAVTLGGLAIGVYAAGGLSAGWVAFGGVAVAWHAAVGGLAWAQDIALGGVTSAANMNDDVAKAFLANSVFLKSALRLNTFTWWIIILLTMLPFYLVVRFLPNNSNATDHAQ